MRKTSNIDIIYIITIVAGELETLSWMEEFATVLSRVSLKLHGCKPA